MNRAAAASTGLQADTDANQWVAIKAGANADVDQSVNVEQSQLADIE